MTYPVCKACGKTKTHHGPECMTEWVYWSQHQVPPHNKQHTVTALVGERGSGKTGGGICLFKRIQLKPFNVAEQVYYRPSQRIHVARRLGQGMVVYGDESTGEGGNKRRAMSTANVDNIMDIDTMRQRHQHTVFTAPDWNSLDSGIQEAVQWVHHFDKAHTVTSYEVIKPSKPDSKYPPYLQKRFITEDFPHAEILYPNLWLELLAAKNEYLAGTDNLNDAKARALEDRMVEILLSVLEKRETPFPANLIQANRHS